MLLTSYYAHSFPSSLFWWLVIGLSSLIQIIWAEQACIKREMVQGLASFKIDHRNEDRNSHPSSGTRRPRRNSLPTTGHELAKSLGHGFKAVGDSLSGSASRFPPTRAATLGPGSGEQIEMRGTMQPDSQHPHQGAGPRGDELNDEAGNHSGPEESRPLVSSSS